MHQHRNGIFVAPKNLYPITIRTSMFHGIRHQISGAAHARRRNPLKFNPSTYPTHIYIKFL
jgi:hypothetical protein